MQHKKKHECQLPVERDTLSYFVPNNRKCKQLFRKACMISNNISHRTVYLKSHWQKEQECAIHLATHYFIIHPFSAFRYYWELFMIVIFINKLLAFPHIMVLSTEYLSLGMYYILILQLICLANIVVEFSSGYFDHATNEVVLQPKLIAKKYICTLLLPEIFASMPLAFIYYMHKYCDFTYRPLLLLNMFNVFSLMDYMEKIRKKRDYGLFLYKAVQYVLIFVFGILWISSSMVLAVCYDQGLELKNVQWMKYVHGSLSLIFNLGQGEITLYGYELLVNVIAVFFGFTMRLLIIVQMILMLNSWFSSHRYYDQLLHEMEIYSHFKFFARSIRKRLVEYYNFVFRNAYYNENDIWGHMSEKLKNEIEHYLFRSWYEFEIFSVCPEKVVQTIMTYVQKEIYVSGDEICRIGDVCTCIYFIKIGTVSFYNSSQQKVKYLEEGNFFAEDVLMFEEDRRCLYSVVATEACEIYKLHRDDFHKTLSEYQEVYEAVQEKLQIRKHFNNYEHRCMLLSEEDTLSSDNTGRRCDRRRFREACLLSSKVSRRNIYSISQYSAREERRYHLQHYFYIIHPFSDLRYYWDIFMILIFLLQLLSVPYSYVLYLEDKPLMTHYVFIMNIICLVNICLNFTTGYFDCVQKKIILDPRKIAFKYLKSYFILDFLASFPFGYVCYLSGVSMLGLRAVSSFRLLHVFSLMLYMDRHRQKLQYSLYKYKTIQIVTLYAVAFSWVTCFIGLAVIHDNHIDFEDLDTQYCLRTSLYLIFGLGHSGFTLFGTEMVVQSVTMIFTTVMRIIVIAHIILFFKPKNALRRNYSQMIGETDEFVHFKSVPIHLKLRMQQYYHFLYHDMFHNETDVWSRVSDKMKAIVHLQVLRQCLETDIFQLCPADTVLALMHYLERRIVLPDEHIYTSGSAAEYMYLLQYGSVALYSQSGDKVTHIEEGNIFGEAALLTYSSIRRFTVTALECCIIFRLHRKFFFFAVHQDAELEKNIQIVLERRKQLLDML